MGPPQPTPVSPLWPRVSLPEPMRSQGSKFRGHIFTFTRSAHDFLRLTCQRFTRSAQYWAVAAAMTLAAVLACAAWSAAVDRRFSAATTSVIELRHRASITALEDRTSDRPKSDFAQRLPLVASIEPIVQELQRSSGANGVSFTSVSSASTEATVRSLGRLELEISLHGAYPKIKSVLAQTLDRFPGLIVQRVSLHRASGLTDLEGRLELILVTRPLTSGAGG